ncbi:vWA domain-containing protein [Vulgatibacter sp.]|uniref:vWA domain-containing protein n=1 Tax=Vulgatibacter sp. TaxID=1971226 RepID=UPI0035654FD7
MRQFRLWTAMAAALALAACGMGDEEAAADGAGDLAGRGGWPTNGDGNGAGGAGGTGGGSWQDGEQYTSYGENEFTDPAEDNLCTFGVDVDTASYAIMRRDVTAGALPVSAGVRTEEYVNYFDYGYEPPAADAADAFAVHLDGAPSPFGEGLQLLRIGIKGKELAAPERGRANLVFLVDVSGSMGEANKLPLVQAALRLLVDELRPDDTIGLVAYAGTAGVVLEPTAVAERQTILTAIDQLRSGGSTNGEAGIRSAYDLAGEHFAQDGINRVILCTDGDLNVGLTGDALIALIEEYRSRGVYLTTLGFGSGNYNDALMEQLADKGNGNYAYVDSMAEAERVLRRDLLGTLVVIAKDVKIQVAIDPEAVARYRLLGYENRAIDDEQFEDPSVDTGDIGSGHDVTALIELELKPEVHEPGAIAANVATVSLRYKKPDHSTDTELQRSISVSGFATSFTAAPESLRFAAAVAEYAEILRRSQFAEGARFADLLEIAGDATADGDPDRLEFIELGAKAKGLWELRYGR